MAATNRMNAVNKKLIGPELFDKVITLSKPTIAGREKLFAIHVSPLMVDGDKAQLCSTLAAASPTGFTGLDINAVCKLAQWEARKERCITAAHLLKSIGEVASNSETKKRVLQHNDRKIVAAHEAGHAVMGWHKKHIPRPVKVMDTLSVLVGGLLAEEICLPELRSNGARDDFRKVTYLGYKWIKEYVMARDVLPLSYQKPTPKEPAVENPDGPRTRDLIDHEVVSLVKKVISETETFLKGYKEQIEKVAKRLLEIEELEEDELKKLFEKHPLPMVVNDDAAMSVQK